MSSGAQAQIAASQAASAASAEAAANALAFSKEIFNFQKGNRQPFINAGHSATGLLLGLLGLQPGLVHTPGTGGGSGSLSGGGSSGGTTLMGLAGGVGSSGGSSGGSRSGGSSGGSSGGYGVPPSATGSYTKPVTGPLDPRVNKPEMTGAHHLPVIKLPYAGIDVATGKPIPHTPPGTPMEPGNYAPWLSVTSGGDPGAPVTKSASATAVVYDPNGNPLSVPISLLPFYQARGYTE